MDSSLQDPADDRFTFAVNVFGLLDTTRAFLPLLRATGGGARIVNVGSVAGVVSCAGSASYSASKFAVEGASGKLYLSAIADTAGQRLAHVTVYI